MKTIIAFALILLIVSLSRYTIFSDTYSSRPLTQQEILALKIREQNRNTDIINSSNSDELQLLHSRSRDMDFNSPHMGLLVKQMRMAVLAHHGLGLAAVQIGIPVRVVLMQQYIKGKNVFKVFINPKVLSASSTTQIFREACLSLPDHDDHLIERSLVLKVAYQTITGQSVVETFTDLQAAVFQQEIDHLNGILIMDYPNLT